MAYDKGSHDALTRLGLKLANIPTARIVPKGSGVRIPTPPPTPPATPPAPTMLPAEGAAPAAEVQNLPSLPSRAMQTVKNIPGRLSGMMRPVRNAVGLAGLGAAGALAYGLHRQNTEDREKQNLVYAPMQGSMMG